MEICRRIFASDSWPNALLLVKNLNGLAKVHLIDNHLNEAEKESTESIWVARAYQLTSEAESSDFANALLCSAEIALRRGNKETAAKHLREARSLPLHYEQRELAEYLSLLSRVPRLISGALLKVEMIFERRPRLSRRKPLRPKGSSA